MALMHCPLCGKEISDQARACPNCGSTVPSRGKNQALPFMLIMVLVLVVFIAYRSVSGIMKSGTGDVSQTIYAYVPKATAVPQTGTNGAVISAKKYLGLNGISKDQLVRLLMNEGFSAYEAEYAALNSEADWLQQALKSAESYLNLDGVSSKQLRRLLETDHFQENEIEYAMDNIVVDWKEQAKKKAQSYTSVTNSRSDIERLLEVAGFNYDEIIFGMQHLNL